MKTKEKILAVIPARGGSKGLPGKNIRMMAGLPLIAHSIALAEMCPEISRTIVSTDSDEIAAVVRKYGGCIPFIRPENLSQDDTAMWPVVRHALLEIERIDHINYEFLILLDPTSPGRLPIDIKDSISKLKLNPDAKGIIGVSQPDFNPLWHCVIESDGWMADLFEDGQKFIRRQDVPKVYRINGSLYIWRTEFVRNELLGWRQAKHIIYEMQEARSIHIDDEFEFERANLLIRNGLIQFPWIESQDK